MGEPHLLYGITAAEYCCALKDKYDSSVMVLNKLKNLSPAFAFISNLSGRFFSL